MTLLNAPWSSTVLMNHANAVAKFSKEQAIFKAFDPWTCQEMAKRYGAMYFFDTFLMEESPSSDRRNKIKLKLRFKKKQTASYTSEDDKDCLEVDISIA